MSYQYARRLLTICCLALATLSTATMLMADSPTVDLAGYRADCGVAIKQAGQQLLVDWPLEGKERGRLTLALEAGSPLMESVSLAREGSEKFEPLVEGVDPTVFVTVGSRNAPRGHPPQMSIWNTFFDNPASRPHQTYVSKIDRRQVKVTSTGRRATVAVGDVTVGPFNGKWQFTVYAGCDLLHVEAVVSTTEDGHAIVYDAGLIGDNPGWKRLAWINNTNDQLEDFVAEPTLDQRPLKVRHRAIVAGSDAGSLVCFSSPHQYQFPRDLTDNLGFVWLGRNHQGLAPQFGLGIRQPKTGGGNFVPWFNAPPDTQQRLGAFYLLSSGDADAALKQTRRYTHDDTFLPLPGHITFTSHCHMAVAETALARQGRGDSTSIPSFVRVFKELGVNAVHLADFHGDGHQKDPGPLRLRELKALFAESRRLSDEKLLIIPGEEVNEFLGIAEPGKHPGHWMSLFPRPVYWIQQRKPEEPFREEVAGVGTVYRVGSREDMIRLVNAEQALVWSAHPRIKASNWTPDIFRKEDFYLSDRWLGAAWKAMPADLSRERLGERGFDLLNDMANWGQVKYLPAEIDVFKIDPTHELYGHMNINYVRLDRLPNFDEGWQPIMNALRAGQFFVTTGEVLLDEFTVGGRQSGETLTLSSPNPADLKVSLRWTFPLKFAEIVSGDGKQVYRQRIDLTDTGPFGERTIVLRPELHGRKWVRFEVWDVAVNGAFTQPVWIKE
jgi:hypothetical protein